MCDKLVHFVEIKDALLEQHGYGADGKNVTYSR